jgi:quercetin dioxygenase-like cupin family protein
VEILRFGPGFRRAEPPVGASGLAQQAIWSDRGTRVTELAFASRAVLPPQTSSDLGLFVVVSGGGWIQVGEERSAINHGEAVEVPPGVVHAAWTDGAPMRAILVEVSESARQADPGLEARRTGEADARSAPRPVQGGRSPTGGAAARGGLAPRAPSPDDHDLTEGEPW